MDNFAIRILDKPLRIDYNVSMTIKKKLKIKHVQVRFSEEDYNKLVSISLELDRPIGSIIREVVKEYLKKND